MASVENPWTDFRGLFAGCALLVCVSAPAAAADFVLCHRGKPSAACVVDGDTFWMGGEKFRPLGLEAPEMGPPKCDAPAVLGPASRDALLELLNSGEIGLERHGLDPFGRTLATVSVGGIDIAQTMIAAGLARPYVQGAPALVLSPQATPNSP